MTLRTISLDRARRIALAAQGFADPRPSGTADVRHLRRVLGRVGLLQIDSVNVVCRAHYMPVFARLGAYPVERLDAMARPAAGSRRGGELFESWGHAASLLPVEDQPLFRWRMAGEPVWTGIQAVLDAHPDYLDRVMADVADAGPIPASGLSDPGRRSETGWWGYGRGKLALEYLFAIGKLGAYRTAHFERLYDLPERILPPEVLAAPTPTREEAHRELLLKSARAHGIGTVADLADYYRLKKTPTRRLLDALVSEGALEAVRVRGWDTPAYLHPEAKTPRKIRAKALLCPFDPVVWNRERAERLFDFHYRIEIYTPSHKRHFGYYVLPFLLDDSIAARVDVKADRQAGALRLRAAHLEPGHDADHVARELAASAREMAGWLGLDEVRVERQGDLAAALARWVEGG